MDYGEFLEEAKNDVHGMSKEFKKQLLGRLIFDIEALIGYWEMFRTPLNSSRLWAGSVGCQVAYIRVLSSEVKGSETHYKGAINKLYELESLSKGV